MKKNVLLSDDELLGTATEDTKKENPIRRGTFYFALISTALGFLYLGYALATLLPGGNSPSPGGSVQVANPNPTRNIQEIVFEISRLEQAVLNNPKNPEAWLELGRAYFDDRQTQNGIKAYETARSLAPLGSDSLTRLGVLYGNAHQPEKAEQALQEALALDPENTRAMFYLGGVYYYDLGDKARAREIWGRLLEKQPNMIVEDGLTMQEWIKRLTD